MILGYADGLVQKIDLLDLSGYESGTFTIVKESFIVNDNGIIKIDYFSTFCND